MRRPGDHQNPPKSDFGIICGSICSSSFVNAEKSYFATSISEYCFFGSLKSFISASNFDQKFNCFEGALPDLLSCFFFLRQSEQVNFLDYLRIHPAKMAFVIAFFAAGKNGLNFISLRKISLQNCLSVETNKKI